MAFQEFELNMIPHGDMPTFYASQYETGRPIIIDIIMGEDAFACDELYIELHCRKVDDNIVTLEPDSVDGNQVTFIGTDQLFACPGKNVAEICLYADDTKDTSLGSLNFFIEVEPDPLAGGLTSESSIYDLRQQIEEITEEVIGEDYYDKTEVDDLLDLKADKSNTYTKTEVDNALNLKADKSTTYTKSQVDSALALKADASSVYTKGQTDTLLNAKANTSDLATVATTGSYDDLTDKPTIPAAQVQSDWSQADNTKVDYIKNKPDLNDYLTVSDYNSDMSDLNDALTNEFNAVEKTEIMNTGTENQTPYLTRTPTNIGNRCLEMLVGGTVAFNQLVNTGDTSINTTSGRKYLTKINSVWSIIQGGSAVTIVDDSADMVIDLTALFGSTIADYIYTLESGTAGAGVAWFRNYFTADYYPYTANTLMSVKTSAKKIYDANNTLIETYDLSGSRKVHRVFGIVEFDGSADENWQSAGTVGTNYRYYIENVGNIKTNNACITNYLEPYNDFGHEFGTYRFSTNGTFIIHDKDKTISDVTALKTYLSNNPLQCGYELETPFDETVTNPELRGIPKLDADNNLYYDGDTCNDFTNPQTVVSGGKEEFVDGRSVEIPVGHDTIYAKKTDYRYW